jgi:hypothetical protein
MKPSEPKNAKNPVSFIDFLRKVQRSSTTAFLGIPSSSVSISPSPNIARVKATLRHVPEKMANNANNSRNMHRNQKLFGVWKESLTAKVFSG